MPDLNLDVQPFGAVDGTPVEIYTLANGTVEITLLTYGGIIQAIRVPDRTGRIANIALGFATLDDYVQYNVEPYFGALVGRYANRIARGRFTIDGTTVQVPINNGPNALHGGIRGFDKHVWAATEIREPDAVGVRLSRDQPRRRGGLPGQPRSRRHLPPDHRRHAPHRLPRHHRRADGRST